MKKHRLLAATSGCLNTFPPIVGIYGLWGAMAPLVPQDPARAFLLGLVIGLCLAAPGIIFATSISAGEK